MKRIFITLIALLALSFTGIAQERILEEVGENYYAYTDGSLEDTNYQIGFFQKIGDDFIRTGTWKHYINGELRSTAVYKNNRISKLIVNGVEYSAKDLYIYRLEKQVERLVAKGTK